MIKYMVIVCIMALAGCTDTVFVGEVESASKLCQANGGVLKIKVDRLREAITSFCNDGTQIKIFGREK